MNDIKVYIGLFQKKALDKNEAVYLKDISTIYSIDEKLKEKLQNTKIYQSKNEEIWDYITSVKIAQILSNKYPNLDINFSGSTYCLLEIKSREKRNLLFEIVRVAFVSITLFFGAALGIMYFHEDVNMKNALERLYYTFTGLKKENPLVMNIPYSIGLGVGMVSYFMRVISTSKRRRMEPGPMDVELYLYDSDLEDFLLNELKENLPRND